ncbi:MAG: lysoplasmalogenase [Christensenellales bacterium]
MTYVFVALMCVFAGAYIYFERGGPFSARLFFKAAAGVMLVLVAVSARIEADEPYYTLIVAGLSFSLGGDIFLLFAGVSRAYNKAGTAAFIVTHTAYIIAFCTKAAPAWYDGAFFLLLISAGFFAFKAKGDKKISLTETAHAILLRLMAARAFSMLFAQKTSAAFSICAAVGGVLFVLSDMLPAFEKLGNSFGRAAGALGTAAYYGSQALIALTVMM